MAPGLIQRQREHGRAANRSRFAIKWVEAIGDQEQEACALLDGRQASAGASPEGTCPQPGDMIVWTSHCSLPEL